MTPSEGERWPAFSKPREDELLSSWLMRLAMAHGLKLHTFCSLAWPGKPIWNRDIDKTADDEIVKTLSEKTGFSPEQVRSTTLTSYEGQIYEKHNHFGPTPWIMPVGVYHRTRTRFGLQFCPLCLGEDVEAYYRRRWRLAFVVVCERHGIEMHDRCPECGAAVNFHRDELGNQKKFVATSMTLCHVCKFDLRFTPPVRTSPPVSRLEVEFTRKLLAGVIGGFIAVAETEMTYSIFYFAVLTQLMKILSMRDHRVDALRRDIGSQFDVEVYTPISMNRRPDVQEQGVTARRQLLQLARCLLDNWPHRFVEGARKHKAWSSLWLRHMEASPGQRSKPAPFWFWRVVHDELYRDKYRPSDEETRAAVGYLKRRGADLNRSSLSRLLGVSYTRREASF